LENWYYGPLLNK